MGNSQSPPSDPRFASASRAFAPGGLDRLQSLFTSLAAQSQSNNHYVTLSVFQAYFGLPDLLGKRLFDVVTQHRKDDKLTFHDLVIAKSIYEKGTNDEMNEFVYQLLDVTSDGVWGRSDVESVLSEIFQCIFSDDSEPGLHSYRENVHVFLNAAVFSEDVEGSAEKSMSFEDFRTWCSLVPSVRKFLGSLLIPRDAGRPGSQVPRLEHGENINSSMLLLTKEYAWHIGGALSSLEMEEWRLLYHSAVNGLSFNTFLGSLSDGPTVLIVKDKAGYLYGGYASQPWEKHGDFYGDMKSFLFQLSPKASIFKPTGANGNVQWCAVNFSSESIPNGIGFGGQVNHFGLFLSASFDTGQTFTCPTFDNPCLSETNRIHPDMIECWGVVKQGAQQEKQDAVRGTVLERFKEDRNMLKLVGLASSSEQTQ